MKWPSIQLNVAEVNLKYLLLYCCLSDGHFLKWNALIINNEQLRECTRIVLFVLVCYVLFHKNSLTELFTMGRTKITKERANGRTYIQFRPWQIIMTIERAECMMMIMQQLITKRMLFSHKIRTFSDLSTCFFFIFTQFDQNIKEEKIGIAWKPDDGLLNWQHIYTVSLFIHETSYYAFYLWKLCNASWVLIAHVYIF